MAYAKELTSSPFGATSRAYILERYFEEHPEVTTANAWEHVYRLLLWVDPTTSLVHCYESDKSQPGRHWYGRSLAFHQFIAEKLSSTPSDLHRQIDQMFKSATRILAAAILEEQEKRTRRAALQRAGYEHFPLPGENPELISEVASILEQYLGPAPPAVVSRVIRIVTATIAQENKRKNLVGEGFEDTLAALIRRLDTTGQLAVHTRKYLHQLPGFRSPAKKEKDRKVDLCLVEHTTGLRTLLTVKWSVRADREEQFGIDYDFYRRHEESGEPFDFVLVTNEMDAARLVMACTRRVDAVQVFQRVVHIQPDGLDIVHASPESGSQAAELPQLRASGRLVGLESLLNSVLSNPRP